jgi:hypothetical protein
MSRTLLQARASKERSRISYAFQRRYLVRHRNVRGALVLGTVMQRIYVYDLADGLDVDGTVTVTIMLEKVQVH